MSEEYPVVYVTNLHPSVYMSSSEIDIQYLEEIFGKFGRIEQTDIIDTNAGSAVISYSDIRDARDAARELNGLELYGKRIIVSMDHKIFGDEESDEESDEEPGEEPGYIIVRGIHPDTTGYEIQQVLNHAGSIDSITINQDYAIVRYHNKDSVEYALKYNNKIIHGIKVNIDVPTKKELINSYRSNQKDDRVSKKSNSINFNRIHKMLTENRVKEAILELESKSIYEQISIISRLVSKVQLNVATELLRYTYRLIKSEKFRIDEDRLDCIDQLVSDQPTMFKTCVKQLNTIINVNDEDVDVLYEFMDKHYSNPGVMKGALLYLNFSTLFRTLLRSEDKRIFQKDEIYTYLKFKHLVYDTVTGSYKIIPALSNSTYDYDVSTSLNDKFVTNIYRLILSQNNIRKLYYEIKDIVNRTTFPTNNLDTEHMREILSHYYFLYDLSRFHKHSNFTFPEVLERLTLEYRTKKYYLRLYYFIYIAIIGRLLVNHSYQDTELFRAVTNLRSFFDELPISYLYSSIRVKPIKDNDPLFIPVDVIDGLFEIYRKFDTIVRQETK